MGSRKENLKKTLGIPEYPWSSDDEEDNSGQRANINNQQQPSTSQHRSTSEARTKHSFAINWHKNDVEGDSGHNVNPNAQSTSSHPSTSQQRSTNEFRSRGHLLSERNLASKAHKPYALIMSPLEEFRCPLTSTPRQITNLSSQMESNLSQSHVDRRIREHRALMVPTTKTRARLRQIAMDTHKLSPDIQHILSFKKLTNRLLHLNKSSNPSSFSPHSSRSTGIHRFTSLSPVPHRHNRSTPQIAAASASTLFTNGEFPEVVVSESQNLNSQRRRTLNIKNEQNATENNTEAADPNINNTFYQNDAVVTATAQDARNDSNTVNETVEVTHHDNTLDNEVIIENLEDILNVNTIQNNDAVNNEENVNEDPTPSTSNPDATTAEASLNSHKRKREALENNEENITVKEFNQGLLRLLECPVCLDWMDPPISQCRRGHLVCGRCRSRLNACPVCRSLFSSVRNRAMEGVAEMLRYPCRHGCGREVKLRRRTSHEASCIARKYQCPIPGCSDTMPLSHSRLETHFNTQHSSMLILGKKHKFSLKVTSEKHDNWLIMAFGELFHLRVDVDFPNWGIIVYVSYIGPKCKAAEFVYVVSVEGQHNGRKEVYYRKTHSDLESYSLNVSRQDCFHLNLDKALNFLRFKNRNYETDKFLDFFVEMSRSEPVEIDQNNSDS